MVSNLQAGSMTESKLGDKFMEEFASHSRAIFTYIYSQVRNSDLTEDIFQSTCKILWQKFDQFESSGSFRAWAIGIARKEILMAQRAAGKSARLFGDQVTEILDRVSTNRVLSADERSVALRRCYKKLSDNDQHLIDLRYQENTTVEMIAAETGRSAHAIYRSFRRIHRALFECINRSLSQGGAQL